MSRNDEFYGNTADFGKDPQKAFDTVQSWRASMSNSPIEIPKVRKRYTRTKPVTNYGAKNGNSREARAKRAEAKAKESDNA